MPKEKPHRLWFYDGEWHNVPKSTAGGDKFVDIPALTLPDIKFEGFTLPETAWVRFWTMQFYREALCPTYLTHLPD